MVIADDGAELPPYEMPEDDEPFNDSPEPDSYETIYVLGDYHGAADYWKEEPF